MTQLYLSLILCLAAMAVQAHIYDPIACEGKLWQCIVLSNDCISVHHITEFRIQGDTVINGIEYKKAQTRTVWETSESEWRDIAAVRDKARRTYIIYTDSWYQQRYAHLVDSATGEILLYDFSLGGMHRGEMNLYGKHVDVGYSSNIMSGGKEWRNLSAFSLDSGVIGGFEWTEGIGNMHGEPMRPAYDIPDIDRVKFFMNGELIYDSSEFEFKDEPASGDANGDGVTDIEDVSAVINAILGYPINEEAWDDVSADIHENPNVDHINYIVNRILGKDKQ